QFRTTRIRGAPGVNGRLPAFDAPVTLLPAQRSQGLAEGGAVRLALRQRDAESVPHIGGANPTLVRSEGLGERLDERVVDRPVPPFGCRGRPEYFAQTHACPRGFPHRSLGPWLITVALESRNVAEGNLDRPEAAVARGVHEVLA